MVISTKNYLEFKFFGNPSYNRACAQYYKFVHRPMSLGFKGSSGRLELN